MKLGYISQRNEDGTSYLCDIIGGSACWSDDRRDRRAFPRIVFDALEATTEASRSNDCPDNGFFGVYNLTWHPKQ